MTGNELPSIGLLVVLLALAFLIETLTEFLFSPLFDKIPLLTPYKWALQYVAVCVGIVGCFLYQFDLLFILSRFTGSQPALEITWFGKGISGIAVGKGSNYLHQFINKFFPIKKE